MADPLGIILFVLPAMTSTLVAILVSRPAIRWIQARGWVDAPNQRKVHDGLVPLAGGAILAIATSCAVLLFGLWHAPTWRFWVAALVIFVISFVDDRYPLRARFRFFVQLAAAALVCSSGIVLPSLGQPLGDFTVSLGIFALPFTIVCIAALTNAINMMDGVDGLAGGFVAIALFWLAAALALLAVEPQIVETTASAPLDTARAAGAIIGSLVVFLFFNMRAPWRKKAVVFMGDAGSMTLGFAVACFAVYAASGKGGVPHNVPAVAIAWVVGLPTMDLLSCFVRRVVIEGRTPMAPDRRHLHHLLMALGLPVALAVPLLHVIAFAMGGIGILGWQLGASDAALGWGLITLLGTYLLFSLTYWARADTVETVRAPSGGRQHGLVSGHKRAIDERTGELQQAALHKPRE